MPKTGESSKQGSSSKGVENSPEASQCPVMEIISQRFNNDVTNDPVDGDAPLEDEEFELSEHDFPPSKFDFQKVLEQLRKEISDEEEDEDFSKLYSEVIANSKKAALEMGFGISEDEIIQGLEEDSKLLVFPTTSRMKETAGKVRRSRSTKEDENSLQGPSTCKKLKINSNIPEGILSRNSSDSNDTQYVFVVEKSTSKKRVISLQKGGELPEGFELASIQEDFPVVPNEVSTKCIEAVRKTQHQSVGDKSKQLSPPDVPSVKEKNIPLSNSPEKRVSPAPRKKSSGLVSLSDLMTKGLNKSHTEAPISVSIPSTSKSSPGVDTQRSSRGKIVNLVNRNGPGPSSSSRESSNSLTPPVVDMITLGSDEDDCDNDDDNDSFTNSDLNVANLPLPAILPHKRNDVQTRHTPIIYSYSQARQSKKSGPVIIQTRSLKRINPLFKCRFCGDTFLCYDDHLFRMHLLLKHEEDIDISDDTYLDENRIFTTKLKECHKCRSYILKMGDHQQMCGASTYDIVVVEEKKLLKHGCGICPKSFSARYELKRHIDMSHRGLWRKIILTPGFRCAQCLRGFDSSLNLLKHCLVCMDLRPKRETFYELAKSFLRCDICGKSHSTVQEVMTCYKSKKLQRCSLCFEVHKDMHKFYQHLNNHHGMVGQERKSGEKMLTLPCPLCPKERRGKYDEIFSHVVQDHYQPVLQMEKTLYFSPFVEGLTETDTQFQRGEIKVPPPQLIAVGNFNRHRDPQSGNPIPAVIVNPTRRVTPSQQAPIVPGRIVINTNRIDPSTSFPPGTFVTPVSTMAPVFAVPTTKFSEGNGKNLVRLEPSGNTTTGGGGVKRVQFPLSKPVNLDHGDVVQFVPNRFKTPLPPPLLRPVIAVPKPSIMRFSVNRSILPKSTAHSVTQPGPNVVVTSTSAFTISTTAQPKVSNVSCLSTAVTFTSPSSASKNIPITAVLPNYAHDNTTPAISSSLLATHGTPTTDTAPKRYIQVLSPNPKLSRLISTATATIANQSQSESSVIPNLPPGVSVHPIDRGSGGTTSTSASTSASNSNTLKETSTSSLVSSLSVSLVQASPEKNVPNSESPS